MKKTITFPPDGVIRVNEQTADYLRSYRDEFEIWRNHLKIESSGPEFNLTLGCFGSYVNNINGKPVTDMELLEIGFIAGRTKADTEFYKAVSEMRRLQREYFRTRDPARLRDAKSAESIVDRMIKEYDEAQQKAAQPDLSDFQGE